MGIYITVILITALLFVGMILMLAAKPRFAGKITGTFLVIAALGGLFFYGYGFSVVCDSLPQAIIRALLGVCGMFVAKMDLNSIIAAPLMQHTSVQFLFWFVHLLALYSTASAAITTVGAEALRRIRLWLTRWGSLNLIYGLTPESLELGKNLVSGRLGAVVFVDPAPDPGLTASSNKIGCVIRSDKSALNADPKFLRAIGGHRKNRKITLYALEENEIDCLCYASNFLAALEKHGILPELATLVIRGHEESAARAMQVQSDRYGYGSVNVFSEANLAARLLIREYPPCNTISFDEDGKATQNFEALIIGFGQVGQAVLRQLIMNGQFEGSRFKAAVFSPDCHSVKGYFSESFPWTLDRYDISFYNYEGRSEELYSYLHQRGERIRYLVISVGSDRMNYEIARDLWSFFERNGWSIPIHLCTHQCIRCYTTDPFKNISHSLYTPELMAPNGIDRLAMIVNHHYQGDSVKGALSEWMECDYFSRMSCRAYADFIPAILKMAGITKADVISSNWKINDSLLETLSRTEHLRWCAFHYCMGFSPMTPEEYESRAREYRKQKAAGESRLIRIGKNSVNRTHSCLIDWDELALLSEKESAITGKAVDYQAMDTQNILILPKLLLAEKELQDEAKNKP